jgi:prevent-host-death family protein
MQIAVSDAKGQLLDLVRRAEGGEDIVLTRHGHAIARLVGIAPEAAERRAALEAARGAASASTGTTAARSQDFLYDDTGLPT